MRLGARRKAIAETNIRLCFPQLSSQAQANLVRQHFESLGIGLMEVGLGWWASDRRLAARVKISGMENLRDALNQGSGVILVSAHFTTLEIGGRFLAIFAKDMPLKALYRPNENPAIEHVMRRNRIRQFGPTIGREDIRGMLRALKNGAAVWYASDQNYGHKYSVFADFFGVPAATNTATSRLAAMTGAKVVPFFTRRLADGTYEQTILPPLENFPGNDASKDATRINQIIEQWVHQAPEQYLWIHRRFKDRPNGAPRFY